MNQCGSKGHGPFDKGAFVLEKNQNEIKYQIECDTSDGTMHCYHLFPGIDLSYTTFLANSCFQRKESLPHVIEIAYCKAGRYECEYRRGFMTYLGEDDLAVSIISSQREEPVFPTGFYDGAAIIIDTKVTGNIFTAPVEGIDIDFAKLVQKYCEDRCCVVMKTSPELSYLFRELCNHKIRENPGYLRLKALEILWLLSNMQWNDFEISAYFSGDTIQKVKALKTALMNRLDEKISLRDLAQEYGLSLTMMKNCFKEIYGKPVQAFRREYKMQVAAKLLLTTDLPITKIAGKLGYENPNKFSSAFKAAMGLPPREYREKNK